MAGEIEQIFVEFVVDDKALTATVDKLAEAGTIDKNLAQTFKQTNTELTNRAGILKEVGGSMSVVSTENKKIKASFDDVNKSVDNFTNNFIEGFEEGVIAELKKAGVSTKEFNEAIKNAGKEGVKSTVGLRTQIRQLTEQMAALKAAGKDNTQQYKDLTLQAGKLRDALNDVNLEIKTAGSDTRVFDGLISAASGVVGAFSVAQGAVALFGDENEDLQKTMVKVQGALALLNGLQAIQNVLQKESAASILATNIATKAQAAAQAVLTFVIGGTTGALKAFRIALALTGVGLLVIGLVALVQAFNDSKESLEDFNAEIEKNQALLEADLQAVRDRTDIEVASAKARGEAETNLIRIRGKALISQIDAIDSINKSLIAQRDILNATSDEWFALNKTIEDNNVQRKKLVKEAQLLEFDLTTATQTENKKRVADAKAAAKERETAEKERLAKLREIRLSEFNDFKASLEVQLLAVKKGSDEELNLKKRIALASLQIELENDKLTQNQRKLAIQKFFQERLELEKTAGAEQRKLALENIASDLNASLQAIEISNEERLQLTESLIQVQAALEIEAANGNAAKIQEIEAKRDRAIKDARLQSIQSTLNEELELYNVQNAALIRQLQNLSQNQNAPAQQRINAIKEITRIQLEAIDKELDALNDQRIKKLISDKQYQLEYEKLQDKKAQVTENGEKTITDTVKQENEKRKASDRERVELIIQTATQILSVVSSFVQNTNERENNAIADKKNKLKDLKDNGAITEKEYLKRLKNVEAEEKKIRRAQAERDKRIAIFQALVNTAAAVAKALPNLVLAGIAAAIGAAQVAAIASRPLPRFAKGTKYAPEGEGIVAEDRPEIVESAGVKTLYSKKSIVRLKKGDIVYNAFETQNLLQKNVPNVSKDIIHAGMEIHNGVAIDYARMAKALKSAIPDKQYGLNIDKNGFTDWVKEGLSTTIYHNKRYGKK